MYWIVDLDACLVEVWTPDDPSPLMVDEVLTWQPDAAVPPLTIDMPASFREVWGE